MQTSDSTFDKSAIFSRLQHLDHVNLTLSWTGKFFREPSFKTIIDKFKMSKEFTAEEIAKHNKENDCWGIIDGGVYDVTSFLPDHPGGKKAILTFAGRDATEEFDMLHDRNVLTKYVPKAKIGVVKKSKL